MTSAAHQKVVIVGAGISGLATAWWLHRKGFDVTVLEQTDHVGGAIQTELRDGFLIEHGPNSALETTPLIGKLLEELGIRDQLVYADESAKNRYVVRDGRLHPIPMNPAAFFRTRLWSTGGKVRLLLEPLHGRAKGEESIAQFVRRRLGQEFLDYAIDPFVAGVYAGDPTSLSVRAAFPKLSALEERYGGLFLGLIRGRRERQHRAEVAKDRAKMFSFMRGLETLPRTIAEKLRGRIVTRALQCRLTQLVFPTRPGSGAVENPTSRRLVENRDNNRSENFQRAYRWRVEYSRDRHSRHIDADAVVLSTPAYAAAEIIAGLHRETAQALNRIPYPPVAVVFAGLKRGGVGGQLDGFGFLVPSKERRQILGTIWSSSVFPERAPIGSVALTSFIGGSRQPELVSLSDEELTNRVLGELRVMMKVEGSPSVILIRRWQRAIPQYSLGHLGIMQDIEDFEHQFPGLLFCSNYRGGIAIGDCVANATTTVDRLESFLTQQLSKPDRVATVSNQTLSGTDIVESR